jgi:arginyl-tRNA synthetase
MHTSLSSAAAKILTTLGASADASVVWERPQEAAHGDLATAACLRLAKQLGRSPRELAEALAEGLRSHVAVDQAEVAGPGYVNLRLTPAYLLHCLAEVREAVQPTPVRSGEAPVIVEYSQPNIAKPLGIHHILGTVIGQALSNLYEHAGYPVIRWNYLGDWGTQFGKLAVAFERFGEGRVARDCTLDELLDLYVRFHQEAEGDATLEDAGREAFRRLEAGDPQLRQFWTEVVAVTKASLAGIYARLSVHFDTDAGESFYEDKMQPIIDEGKRRGVFKVGEGGSLIVTFPEDSKLPPYLILKGDGATLYSTRDLAQMAYRMAHHAPQAIYILTDVAQKLHFEQLVATCQQLGWELPAFENVLFGRMRFADRAMSTRKGNILKLEHVLDEAVERARDVIDARGEAIQTDDPATLAEQIGVGALTFGILSQNRKMDLVFDWEKFLSFDGCSAPYVQYTYARTRSVLRKAGAVPTEVTSVELSAHDRALLLTLLELPTALQEAREQRLPHRLAQYVFALCQAYNAAYNADQILSAPPAERALRLTLTLFTADVLRCCATLLTLKLPERM